MSPEEMAVFRRNLALRQQAEHLRLAQRYEVASQVVQSTKTLLKQDFQAREVILFGSLLHRERFHLSSDIDLAVRGLDPLDYFTAVAKLQDISSFKIDLVRLETCKPSLAVVITTEGQPL
ncbi:nucleotidyltransferase (plasmid) [Leptolyngbya sp. BL0902]|nr:nucleotidyltransferase [Leptolyngbya sp. BL0902]